MVIPLEQLAAAVVADTGPRRWLEEHMPDAPALPAGAAARQPPDYLVVVYYQLQDNIQLGVQVRQELAQRLGLRHGPREPVEQEPGLRVRLLEPGRHHPDRDLVGYQVTPVHIGLGLLPELGPGTDVVPETIACRDLRD